MSDRSGISASLYHDHQLERCAISEPVELLMEQLREPTIKIARRHIVFLLVTVRYCETNKNDDDDVVGHFLGCLFECIQACTGLTDDLKRGVKKLLEKIHAKQEIGFN